MESDDLVIRRAQAPDAAAVAGVWLRSFAEALPGVRRAHGDEQVRTWFREAVLPLRETWVAARGDTVVGMMVLGEGELEQLYLDPAWRGRGLGSRFAELAKRRRPEGLELWTFQVNGPARRFYERHGFTAVEYTDGRRNEEREPDVRYVWRPSPAVGVRELTAEDWADWRELRLAALAEAPRAFSSRLADWQGDGDREERWRARLSVPGAHFAALLAGRPVGQASGVAEPGGNAAELISMWVLPAARGRGAGDVLVRAVERWAGEAGARELRLSVMPDNARAAALYRRHGFEDRGPVGDELPDGRREHVMVKPLVRG